MNYIKALQKEVRDHEARSAQVAQALIDFEVFLGSAKFTGDENGERKDWIATSDVIARLRELRGMLA